jgi:hypothetical protein
VPPSVGSAHGRIATAPRPVKKSLNLDNGDLEMTAHCATRETRIAPKGRRNRQTTMHVTSVALESIVAKSPRQTNFSPIRDIASADRHQSPFK